MSATAPILVIAAALLAGCAQNPATGQSDFVLMSEEQELALGRQASGDVQKEYARYEDPALQAYVRAVGERLAARSHRSNLVYRFTVVDSHEVNAFALPGGYIYITRGLLALLDSEADLAAVLGHEIGHVTARHSVRQYTAHQAAGIGYTIGAILLPELRAVGARDIYGLLGTALLRGYGRDHELEADGLGAEYLARAGYDPNAMLSVIGVLKNQELFERARAEKEGREPNVYHGVFSTHPDNDTRLQEVVGSAKALAVAGQGRVERDAFLDAIDGLAYGPSAREGVLRGNRFYHRDLGFALEFPEGWRVENRPDRLVAHPPANDAVLMVLAEDLNKRIPPETFIRERLHLEPESGQTLASASGQPAYSALVPADTPYGRRTVRLTVVYFADKAYLFVGALKSTEEPRRYLTEFLNTALGLRALTGDERALAQERRIRVIDPAPDTGYDALADRSGLDSYAVEQLRLLNGDYPAREPRPGRRLKIVE